MYVYDDEVVLFERTQEGGTISYLFFFFFLFSVNVVRPLSIFLIISRCVINASGMSSWSNIVQQVLGGSIYFFVSATSSLGIYFCVFFCAR